MLENDPPAQFFLAAVKSPKNTALPLAAMLTKSITLLFGVLPPPQTALTPVSNYAIGSISIASGYSEHEDGNSQPINSV